MPNRAQTIDIECPPLSDTDLQELNRLSRLYQREAERCRSAKAYLAASVMLGAWLEAKLLLFSNKHRKQIEAARLVPTAGKKLKPVLKWNLAELLTIAQMLNWLPSGRELGKPLTADNAKVGDYAEVIRIIRNLLHPGRYITDHRRKRVTLSDLEHSFMTCQTIQASLRLRAR